MIFGILMLLPVILGVGGALFFVEGSVDTVFALMIDVLLTILGWVLLPINLLIGGMIPEFSNIAGYVTALFDMVSNVSAWLINSIFITPEAITMVAGYYVATFGISMIVWSIKLLLRWKVTLVG